MLFSIDPLADLEVTNAVRRIHIAEALSYRRINPLLVYFVFETPEGEVSSSAPQIVYWILLIIGVAGAVAGFVVKPKKGVQE